MRFHSAGYQVFNEQQKQLIQQPKELLLSFFLSRQSIDFFKPIRDKFIFDMQDIIASKHVIGVDVDNALLVTQTKNFNGKLLSIDGDTHLFTYPIIHVVVISLDFSSVSYELNELRAVLVMLKTTVIITQETVHLRDRS